ncbi:MAG: hypothetical protein KAJ07_09245 [Planctomycetes bacterium]|nr:hypothetical protein [Planctomycetota bacterium]
MPDKSHYLSLQPSEKAIFQAAANIYAAYIASNQVNNDNQAKLMKKSINAAIAIAKNVENIIQSDEEMSADPSL